jgi:hypothetical protein
VKYRAIVKFGICDFYLSAHHEGKRRFELNKKSFKFPFEGRTNTVLVVAAIFAMAELAGAYTAIYYSNWVANLYANNRQGSFETWYQINIALTGYANYQWIIWALEFPTSTLIAIFAGITGGWLQKYHMAGVLGASALLFFVNIFAEIILLCSGFGIVLTFVPVLVLYAFLLSVSLTILTSIPPRKFFRPLVFYGLPAGLLLGIGLAYLSSTFLWVFAGIQISWGVTLGIVLVPADIFRTPNYPEVATQ